MVASVSARFRRTLSFLDRLVDWEREAGLVFTEEVIRLDLFREALARIGDPHLAYRTIIVAGTKGKGSTSLLIARLLSAHGIRTGLFTSPHLSNVRERIRLDNRPIGREDFADVLETLRDSFRYFEGMGESRTFFETMAAAAFLHFRRVGVEAAVLEVGLGGRLDATNVAEPDLSVITPISRDHVRILGPNLIAIAGEKAGVIRPGRPLLIGKQRPRVVRFLRERAEAAGCPVQLYGEDFEGRFLGVDRRGTWFDYVERGAPPERIRLGLLGEHQAWNGATALAALPLFGVLPDRELVRKALRCSIWAGRGEFLSRNPPVLLDGAHNGDSAEALARLVRELFPGERPVLVFGGSRGKDFPTMFRRLLPAVSDVILTESAHPRAAPASELERILRRVDGGGRRVRIVTDARRAVVEALRGSRGRPVLITGSLYLAGRVRPRFGRLLAESRRA
ncbi:MAG: bifunctional folylpolyglutamate synthase/dihydrofolate synthase [Candidatus Eisenbacteria bacterium]|nr:bifunctional folylpolyglutamate synthase/dihydrofolate synthase [Candidatus Eisenbacteria bacterium]